MRLRKTGLLLLLISSLETARPLLCSTRLPLVTTALLLIQGSWAKAKAAARAAFPLVLRLEEERIFCATFLFLCKFPTLDL